MLGSKIPYAKSNEFLDRLESLEIFKDAMVQTKNLLEAQWLNAVASDMLDKAAAVAGGRRYRSVSKAASKKPAAASGEAKITSEELFGAWVVGPLKLSRANRITLRQKLLGVTEKSMEFLGKGSKYNDYLRRYLHRVANHAGQDVLTAIAKATHTEPLKFRLGKRTYQNLVKARVDQLIKGLDATSKKRMASELIKGFEIGATKKQMVKRLTQVADDLTWDRADIIVRNETAAVSEWMRWKTARLNGVSTKQWITCADERVCKICDELHGEAVSIEADFSNGMTIPPAHTNCRCFLRYDIEESLAEKDVRKSSVWDRLDTFIKSDPHDFYDRTFKTERPVPCVNPEALWAGGESLVGKDKSVGKRIREIESQGLKKINKSMLLALGRLLANLPTGKIDFLVQVIHQGGNQAAANLLESAKRELTVFGFVQVVKYFGFSGKIDIS